MRVDNSVPFMTILIIFTCSTSGGGIANLLEVSTAEANFSLAAHVDKGENISEPDTYLFTDNDFENIYEFNSSSSEENEVIIKKCCALTESLNIYSDNDTLTCQTSNGNDTLWKPWLYLRPEERLEDERNISFTNVGLPNCKWTVLENSVDTWFNILEDGNVSVGLNFWTIPVWLKPSDSAGYCVDHIENTNEYLRSNDEQFYVLVFCELENFNYYMTLRIMFLVLYLTSSISLLITIVIYILMWSDHSIHGWTQFSFFLSFFMFFTTEGSRMITKLNGLTIKPSKICFLHAMAAHYFTVVMSGTSCMMSLDCFVTFWKLRSVRSKTKRELTLYLFFSWIVPLVSLAVGLYLHFRNNPDAAEKEVHGVFQWAHYRCSSPVWESAFRVQIIILSINFMAFIETVCLIIKHFRSTRMANVNVRTTDKTWRKFKKSFKLFLKLFLITGITWVVSGVDLVLGYENPMGWIFVLLRAYLSLQGVVYMMIFGFHRKNFVQIRKKYPIVDDTVMLSWMFRSIVDRQRSNIGVSRNPGAHVITTCT